MRRSEVLGLRWSNIDMEAGRLAVVDTVVVVNHRPVLRIEETKSRRSRRSVALDLGTVAILREHRAAQAAERLLAGPAWRDLGMVFSDELGQVVNPVWFTRATKSLARAAGVPPLTPHAAGRHTWATLALSSGIPAKVVADRFGHSTVAVTLDRYSHVIEGMDREAAEKVATLFR
jgi:integrase